MIDHNTNIYLRQSTSTCKTLKITDEFALFSIIHLPLFHLVMCLHKRKSLS